MDFHKLSLDNNGSGNHVYKDMLWELGGFGLEGTQLDYVVALNSENCHQVKEDFTCGLKKASKLAPKGNISGKKMC